MGLCFLVGKEVVRLSSLLVLKSKEGHGKKELLITVAIILHPQSSCDSTQLHTSHLVTVVDTTSSHPALFCLYDVYYLPSFGTKSHGARIWRESRSYWCLFGVRFMFKLKNNTMLTMISLSELGTFLHRRNCTPSGCWRRRPHLLSGHLGFY